MRALSAALIAHGAAVLAAAGAEWTDVVDGQPPEADEWLTLAALLTVPALVWPIFGDRTARQDPAPQPRPETGTRPSGAVNARAIAWSATAGAAWYVIALLFASSLPMLQPALPVLYAIAVCTAAASAYVLAVRARAVPDPPLHWVAWAYGLAAVAMAVQILGFPTIAPGGGPLGTTSSGAAALYVLWHLIIPAFILLASRGRRVRWGAVLVASVLIAWCAYGAAPLPTLIEPSGSYSDLLVALLVATTVLSAVATVWWARRSGPRPSFTRAWVTASLAFGTWDVALHIFAGERFTVFWWASLSMRVAQFVVLAAGLLSGFVRLFAALDRHERALQERLDQELRDARRDRAEQVNERESRRRTVAGVHGILDGSQRLVVVFQPIVSLDDERVVGYEALSRFPDDPRRVDQVFADAAGVGLSAALEARAVAEALAHLPSFPADVYVSVNLSPASLSADEVRAVLAGVDGSRVVLEITEHDRIDDLPAVLAAIAGYRRRGFRIALDDAGAGFAGLHHIVRLDPDIVKLDVSLTRQIDVDPVRQALTSSIVRFAGETGKRIVAEGVESEHERDALHRHGVQCGQGYLFARPAPLEQLLDATTTSVGPPPVVQA